MGAIGSGLEIVADILRRLRESAAARRRELLARVRAAIQKAGETGDTTDLENIRDDLPSGG